MESIMMTTYKEDSFFKKIMKKLFKSFFKKSYILVIDQTVPMLDKAKEERNQENDSKKEEKQVVINKETKVAKKNEEKLQEIKEKHQELNIEDEYLKIKNGESNINSFNKQEIYEIMRMLNEELIEKSKKLNKKIKLIEAKI